DDSKRDLRGIDYRGKTITSISFKDANLRGVLIDDRTQFVSCNAEGAIFVPQILVIAVEQNHLSLVKLVLQSNAAAVKKKGKDSCGDTPLHTAIKKKYVAIALALIVACPEALEVTNNFGETPIDIMVALKQINVIKAVINPTSSVEILEKLYNLSHQHGFKEVQFHLANALVLKKASSMDSGAMTLLKQYVGEAGWYGFFVKGHWNHHYAAQINKLLANEKLTVQDIHGELVKIRTGVGNKWNPQGSLAQIIEAIELLNPSLTATLSRASSVSQISY
ncbi:MAG: ankyrin repeat domain-containing protein, partial [Gammaproteobacteria bacterium]